MSKIRFKAQKFWLCKKFAVVGKKLAQNIKKFAEKYQKIHMKCHKFGKNFQKFEKCKEFA